MAVWDVISDLIEAATPWSTASAEAAEPKEEAPEHKEPEAKENDDEEKEGKEDEKEEVKEEGKDEGKEDDKDEDEEEEEEEEEDEEDDEPKDPKDGLEEECKNSKQCHGYKHHYDECVERVTSAADNGGEAKEDCIEEFMHLTHCATQCAAPRLWSKLK